MRGTASIGQEASQLCPLPQSTVVGVEKNLVDLPFLLNNIIFFVSFFPSEYITGAGNTHFLIVIPFTVSDHPPTSPPNTQYELPSKHITLTVAAFSYECLTSNLRQ
uniref:Uncharacterized protein n=1 Tax=Hippocampus comes TaxID=109280 RepID=A0A3Q2ZEU8_HIPCM